MNDECFALNPAVQVAVMGMTAEYGHFGEEFPELGGTYTGQNIDCFVTGRTLGLVDLAEGSSTDLLLIVVPQECCVQMIGIRAQLEDADSEVV